MKAKVLDATQRMNLLQYWERLCDRERGMDLEISQQTEVMNSEPSPVEIRAYGGKSRVLDERRARMKHLRERKAKIRREIADIERKLAPPVKEIVS